jgi:hypothetical protein
MQVKVPGFWKRTAAASWPLSLQAIQSIATEIEKPGLFSCITVGAEQDRQLVGDRRSPAIPPRRQAAADTPPDSPQAARSRPCPYPRYPLARPFGR